MCPVEGQAVQCRGRLFHNYSMSRLGMKVWQLKSVIGTLLIRAPQEAIR